MNRALITGGTGFVGKHLVPFLQQRGSQVAVLAQACCVDVANVNWYEADIRDEQAVRSAVRDFKPAHIYHLAAISAVDFSWNNPRLTYEVNVFGTLNVIQAAINLPTPVRILNVSTAQVYAPSSLALTETSSLNPENPYAASKAMAEFLRVQFRKSSKGGVITARSFNHTGPGQSTDFVLSSMAKQFAEIEAGLRDPKLVMGNVHVKRDFTDVRDVVEAYALLLEKGEVNESYNVCSGRARSIEELIREFESLTGIQVEIQTDPNRQRIGENDFVCGSLEKIKATTGWEPKIPLRSTLHDVLSYWRTVVRENNARSACRESDESVHAFHLQAK